MSLSDKSNINPKLWGPYFWETIHFVAYGYPEKPNKTDKKVYAIFYKNMMRVLPCDKCANSAQELFTEMKIEDFLGPLYGKMKMGDKIIYHKTAYDFDSLKNTLESIGMGDVETYDWRETEHGKFDDHSQSYLPHMDKENGKLMSLNVQCKKKVPIQRGWRGQKLGSHWVEEENNNG